MHVQWSGRVTLVLYNIMLLNLYCHRTDIQHDGHNKVMVLLKIDGVKIALWVTKVKMKDRGVAKIAVVVKLVQQIVDECRDKME